MARCELEQPVDAQQKDPPKPIYPPENPKWPLWYYVALDLHRNLNIPHNRLAATFGKSLKTVQIATSRAAIELGINTSAIQAKEWEVRLAKAVKELRANPKLSPAGLGWLCGVAREVAYIRLFEQAHQSLGKEPPAKSKTKPKYLRRDAVPDKQIIKAINDSVSAAPRKKVDVRRVIGFLIKPTSPLRVIEVYEKHKKSKKWPERRKHTNIFRYPPGSKTTQEDRVAANKILLGMINSWAPLKRTPFNEKVQMVLLGWEARMKTSFGEKAWQIRLTVSGVEKLIREQESQGGFSTKSVRLQKEPQKTEEKTPLFKSQVPLKTSTLENKTRELFEQGINDPEQISRMTGMAKTLVKLHLRRIMAEKS